MKNAYKAAIERFEKDQISKSTFEPIVLKSGVPNFEPTYLHGQFQMGAGQRFYNQNRPNC